VLKEESMSSFKPYKPSLKEYPELSEDLESQLSVIEPSHDNGIKYYPCVVTLDDNSIVDGVYIVNAQEYINIWGVWPDEDSGKREVDLKRVIKIENSRNRLPPHIADEIYTAGESGMGYCVFTLLFNDGSRHAYVTGNAVDFIQYPNGKSSGDIKRVLPHEGRDKADENSHFDYYWCLYG
jgi:hypothetical protein